MFLLWFLMSFVYAEESGVELPSEVSESSPLDTPDQSIVFETSFQQQRWNDAESAFIQIADPSFAQFQQGAECAVMLGRLQIAYTRYQKAFSKRFTREEPRNFRLIEAKTVLVSIEGEGSLMFEGDTELILLRAVDAANQDLKQEKRFSGRLPLGLYRFQEGGLLVTRASTDKLDKDTLERMLVIQKEKNASLSYQVFTNINNWLIEPTSYKARGGIHTQFFGSELADISMQSVWSVGPTVGMIWTKRTGDWGLGLESNIYFSASTRSFMSGINGSVFGEYALPKGFLLAGVRYDFSGGRIVGITLREQSGSITSEELDALAVAGVALSLGLWTEYRYPIRQKIDVFVRLGFRNDAKRMYFDGDLGVVFPLPF